MWSTQGFTSHLMKLFMASAQLNLSQSDPSIQLKVTALVKKYWSVFDEHGVWVPVWNYECVIDTGNTHPIAVKKIQY